ncbi:hypothetical protein DYU11_04480 [Fibrisoma montanum]|uniref:Uncharacterized protein n=1 Tax=Fibrisoma montanum TaxID=2305895 RepID=A0A418MJJ2_9BACT|nr:hypothetical protein DYU11_04480 [Fibrisoma montanum]
MLLFGCCVAVVDELPVVVPDVAVIDPLVLPVVVGLDDIVPEDVELPWLPDVVPLVAVELCVPVEVPDVELFDELVDWALAAKAVSATSSALAAITFFIT